MTTSAISQSLQRYYQGRVWITPEVLERLQRITPDGHSARVLARECGVSVQAVYALRYRLGLTGGRSDSARRRANNPESVAGARRLERTRRVCALLHDGWTRAAIAREIGVRNEAVRMLIRTPYARYLIEYMYPDRHEWTELARHCRAMYREQGLPIEWIARKVGRDVRTVERWVVGRGSEHGETPR